MTLRVTRVVTASILFKYNYFRNIGRLMVFASPIVQLEDGMYATDADPFTKIVSLECTPVIRKGLFLTESLRVISLDDKHIFCRA